MTELVKLTSLPARQGSILPVKDVVQLKEHADELDRIALEVNDVLRRFEKFEKGEHYRFTPSTLPDLPAHAARTIALVLEMSRTATTDDITDCLLAFNGLWGAHGDPNIVASVGVDLIEIEKASRIALYAAFVSLLRPVTEFEGELTLNGWNGDDVTKPRRFRPNITEIILEVREQEEKWFGCDSGFKDLLERYAKAKRINDAGPQEREPKCLIEQREREQKEAAKKADLDEWATWVKENDAKERANEGS
jgi:hypothetical protein